MVTGRGCIFDVAFSKIANKERCLLALETIRVLQSNGRPGPRNFYTVLVRTQLWRRLFQMFFIIQIADMLLDAPRSPGVHVVYIPT